LLGHSAKPCYTYFCGEHCKGLPSIDILVWGYYQLRGGDKKTGVSRLERLRELELNELVA